MKKFFTTLLTLPLFLLQSCSDAAPADAGKLRIKANKAGAYIYVDSKKKAMANSTSYTNILLAEGEYKVKVEKHSDDGEWLYTQTKNIFVGSDTSQKVSFKLNKQATEKRKQRLAQEEMVRKQRLERLVQKAKEHTKRYIIHDNGTVTDKNTGLMWMRCSLGQTWDGNTCTGKAKTYKWQAAQNKAKQAEFAGKNDWRVPTIDELHTLAYCSSGKRRGVKRKNGKTIKINGELQDGECLGDYEKPTVNQIAFPNTPANYFWSSSPYAGYSSYAWELDFGYGYGGGNGRIGSNRVRLVRFGQ